MLKARAKRSSVATLLSPTKDGRGIGKNARVVVGHRQRLFRQSDGLLAARRWIFRPAVETKSIVAYARPRYARPYRGSRAIA
jgi:hypothetical protein